MWGDKFNQLSMKMEIGNESVIRDGVKPGVSGINIRGLENSAGKWWSSLG